jgi:hypothetical protein
MKVKFLILTALFAIASVPPQLTKAQTKKMTKRMVEGKQVSTPYITSEELRSATILRRGTAKSHAESDAQTRAGGSFSDLYTITSLGEVYKQIGRPQSIERGRQADILQYDGMRLVYVKTKGKSYLQEMEVVGSRWSFTVNEKEISPGADVGSLSPAVRQSIESYGEANPKNTHADAAATIRVEGTDTETRFLIRINQVSGTVESILFHRLV